MPRLVTSMCILAVLTVSSASAQYAVCLNFAARTDYAGGGSDPFITAVGDFNNDGKRDLVAVNIHSANVSVFLGNGSGGFAPGVLFGVGTTPIGVAVGDFNGDGKDDLAVANAVSNNVSILIGNGTGGFSAPTNFAGGNTPYGIAAGDFNGDGRLDLATTNYTATGTVSILLGDGGGGFAAPRSFNVGNKPAYVAVGDFNRDGHPDLAIANQGSNNVAILSGDGAGNFSTAGNYPAGSQPASIAIADFNGDGQLDVAVANIASNNVSILLGTGNGALGAATSYGEGVFVTVGDFNGDGMTDIAVIQDPQDSLLPGHIMIMLGNGAGAFVQATTFTVGNGTPGAIAVADFNRDGKADIAVPNQDAGNVSILINNSACYANCGTFAAAVNYPAGASPFSVVVGDFNRDGKPDLAIPDYLPGGVSVLLANGPGTFAPAVLNASGGGAYVAAVGDFNGDGKSDLAVTNQFPAALKLMIGDGSGGFTTSTNALPAAPYSVVVADLNHDGHDDILLAVASTNGGRILEGVGDVSFTTCTYTAGTGAYAAAAGDFNGDGKLDVVVANETANTVSILLNSGQCQPQTAVSYPVGTAPRSVAVGDFNGDGKLDLAVANHGDPTVSILLGDGAGGFGAAVTYGTGANPNAVVTADFNADGKLDLAVANYTSNTVSILFGNGNGTFAAKVDYAVGTTPQWLAVADFNLDGKPDLAVVNSGSNNVSILINTCPFVDLLIVKSHTGDFDQGQPNVRYGIRVTNVGTASTPAGAQVSVTDTPPPGLMATSINGGADWTCNFGTLTCTRSDALAPLTSYDEITMFATVASTAPAVMTNRATVSGGADINSLNNISSDPANVNPNWGYGPTHVLATASSLSQVDISWDPVTNATSYQVFRSPNNSTTILIGTPTSTGTSDVGLSAETTYIYQVAAVNAAGNVSFMSAKDLATTIFFTDDPLPSGSVIKASHFIQLRTAVSAVMVAAGITPSFTYANSIGQGAVITADQINELRDDLFGACFFIGNLPFMDVTFSDYRLTPHVTVIKAAHVREMRNAVK